jgi:hypothetical protein
MSQFCNSLKKKLKLFLLKNLIYLGSNAVEWRRWLSVILELMRMASNVWKLNWDLLGIFSFIFSLTWGVCRSVTKLNLVTYIYLFWETVFSNNWCHKFFEYLAHDKIILPCILRPFPFSLMKSSLCYK